MASYNLSVASSLTNSSSCPDGIFWDWLYSFLPVYIMVVCIFGLVGNIFVLLVLCLQRSRRTVPEIYLGNLAGADLLLLSCLPFWAANIAERFAWPFGQFLCRFVNLTIYMNLWSSIYLLVMVSIDRYLALVRVFNPGRIRTVFCAKVNCGLIWAFSLLMSSHAFLFRSVVFRPDLNMSACLLQYPQPDWEFKINIVFIVGVFVIPGAVLSFCTAKILSVLRNGRLQHFTLVRKESKAAGLILIVLLAFLVCWVPFQIFRVLKFFHDAGLLTGCAWNEALNNGNQIVTFFGCTNSCINPILYVMVGKQFRSKVKELYTQSVSRRKSLLTFRDSTVTHNTPISTLERLGR
ncbi:B2 bradykinin receptor [Mobula birostris]|uniref:B2 bradykinin receptor n=1 Tax=Mobula birostris TaxID=1983395 RepID=UPI003B2807A4